MPSSNDALGGDRSRRELLAATGGLATLAVAGCSERLGGTEPEGEGDTVEVIVGNGTDEPARIAVRIEDDTGAMLFGRVYELGPHKADESAGIDTAPSTVIVFTPAGGATTWEYDPDLDVNCEEKDVGITLLPDGSFERYYTC
ncbi:hypothetical protein BRD05_08270 [Halobacteriales archaeon QS_9_70_65]|nr:MAG: hypothetical protein BRD05_08270 [Halobacteriales archaeon QS_9_70_65]